MCLVAILFLVNGIAVLSEDRFLARIGWSSKSQTNAASNSQFDYGSYGNNGYSTNAMNMNNGGGETIKSRLINLINAIRTLMRIPLIIVNILVILYELVLG